MEDGVVIEASVAISAQAPLCPARKMGRLMALEGADGGAIGYMFACSNKNPTPGLLRRGFIRLSEQAWLCCLGCDEAIAQQGGRVFPVG